MPLNPFTAEPARQYIDGEWREIGPLEESLNPATDETLGQFHDGGLDAANEAIAAAHTAFTTTSWRTDREQRARALWDLSLTLERNLDRIARAITLENGKPLAQAQFELSIAAPKLRYFAGQALTDLGTAAETPSGFSILSREPIGVAGVIVPWNSPGILSIRSIAPALAAGCTVAVKMPAQTALTNALIAGLFAETASLPAGVVNFFTESGDEGAKALVADRRVGVISYTGSSAVGARIMAAAAPQLKRVSLELGGKTPMIVFDDADFDAVVPTLTAAVTTFAGQFCMTGSRVLAHSSVADELRERLATSLRSVQVGPGIDPDTQMGPLIDHASVDRVSRMVGESGGEVILAGGPTEGRGAFYRPALIGVTDLDSRLVQDEVFGPVATFETFDSDEEAVFRANATDYGLAASVWTRDGARSLRVSQAIEAGTVWTNAWAQIFDQFEEGGYKKSGLGRLNGPGGLAEFQEVKHIYRSV
ncbi:aldehyde dehydrogenase family protein [Herbiconiux sp. KACC 21604]|uniref:aldehyde dehydrogenase family protein n=1 Tax=unclassified Herbiconiux TaxID=2618217 RepID=UPI001491CF99|nr:aldehyde dehydrogenase family protein [Herbiconiux sp. SALV-R1]QJU55670.1 aldehyde dehydrogenase family protein [Herbiconiux sp. SALV-R1]WPO86873.1 aldehyde dehydrogenase family protein [Herbiconiux sp. KACC 21604]